MLQALKSRQHEIFKVYSCSDAGDDLMFIGGVTWTYNNGQVAEVGFAARTVIVDAGSEKPKMKPYQVWAVRLLLEILN